MRPAGWPAALPDPDDPDFPGRATGWLLDIGPAEWRRAEVLRRHPQVLAFRARHEVAARLAGARSAYAEARADLDDVVGPPTVTDALDALESEGAALLALQREVALVEDALRGRRWRPRL